MQNKKSFLQWLSESKVEAELRSNVHYLHSNSKAWRYGIQSGDLYHDVVLKLLRHNHEIPTRQELFSLVRTTALNHLMDLSKKHSFRGAFFSKPMPTRLRPTPGSTMETVASKAPSPAIQAALNDEVARIRMVAVTDPKLEAIFHALEELTGKGESASATNLSHHLDLPCKQVRKSMEKLRSAARRNI